MDFDLSEKHKLLRDRVRQFAAEKVAPVADKFDRTQQFPLDNFRAMGKLGLTGLAIPEEFGGSGADHLAFAIAAEELSRACASTSDILNAHLALCTEPIFMYGNAQQRKKFLPDLVKAEKVGAFGITEADAGSDIASIKSTAVRQGDHYVLNGIKVFITNGDVSDTAVVFANIPELGKRGMTAFIVENGMTGYIKGKKYDKLGMRAGTNCDLVFENCRVPLENRLGEEGQGMAICLSILDYGRIGIAAQGVGLAQAALDLASSYSRGRKQFGSPICSNQGISWKLADIYTQLEAARLLTYKAAWLADRKQPFSLCAAMAKLTATELAMKAATEGVQIMGGYGYMMDSPMQRYFRDAKLTTIYEGTSEVQRMVISRALTRA
ncbi:MAG: acyl-CoA dehydrogenase family protein [Dehalococcoidia bacterium]